MVWNMVKIEKMKIKLLTICLLLSSFSAQSNDLKTCKSVANHLNENLIDKANSALKRDYQDIKIKLIKTYCDTNSNNNVRFNYKYKLMNRDYITSEGRKHMYDQLCSKFNQLKPMFKIVSEMKYHYYKKNGDKMGEISLFEKTCM
jgi:hypothetical protein